MWGKQSTFTDLKIKLILPNPSDGCTVHHWPKDSPKNTKYAFVVIGISDCPLASLIHNAQMAQAQAVFIINQKDTDVNTIEIPPHMAGVQIHVFMLNNIDGEKLITMMLQDTSDDDPMINIQFTELARTSKTVNLKFITGPDDHNVLNMIGKLADSQFLPDLLNKNIEVDLGYTILHCSTCEERGYTSRKDDCLSGGRYCMKSLPGKNIGGEVMLVQTIKNICAERILKASRKDIGVWEYYWSFAEACLKSFDPKCSNAILTKLNIKKEVFECINKSFIKMTSKGDAQTPSPNIVLEDNTILKDQKSNFDKIKNYNKFPMLKINDWIYNGDIDYNQVMSFICYHIKSDLKA